MTGGAVQGQGDDDPRVSDRHTLGPTIARPRLTPNGSKKAGHRAPWHALHHRCVGCGTQGRPGRSDRRFALYERSGDRRRGTRRIGAATAIEWPAVRSALREAVPGEVRAGSAGAPARVPGASRPAVRGSRRSGRCTCAKHSAQAVSASANGEPRACAGEAGARRAERGDERGAKRARGCCGCRRTSVNIVRRRLKRERNGPRHRSDAARVRLRPRCAEPECRAAAPCRRGSR